MSDPVPLKGLLILAIVAIGYVAMLRIMANTVYAERVEMHKIGDALLNGGHLSPSLETFVRYALGNAMTYRGAIWWAVGGVVMIGMAIGELFAPAKRHVRTISRETAKEVWVFVVLYLRSIFVANPIVGCVAYALMRLAFLIESLKRPVSRADTDTDVAIYAATRAA